MKKMMKMRKTKKVMENIEINYFKSVLGFLLGVWCIEEEKRNW